ncbi:MAG TPA: hypothetical protein VFI40_12225 [Nocardioides sp.]|nr:hypothetical protein [Nocardioides sp.]
MTTATNPHTASATPSLAGVLSHARHDPAYAAFWLLRIGFVVLPLWMGIDKFAKVLNTDWPGYLAPWIVDVLPFSAQTAMYVVGVVEIVAGILVALKPRYASYVVALWLAGIIINLLTFSGFYDIALRDFGLLVAAVALAWLSAVYDGALSWSRHHGDATPTR